MRIQPRALWACFLLLCLTVTSTGAAQTSRLLGLRTPMRDGVTLVSDVWLPADRGQHPLILIRTPYGRANLNEMTTQLAAYFTAAGYAFAIQDVRGRGDSDGDFDFFFQEEHDGYDSIEWLAQQSWSDGRIGMMGVSYMGTVQWLAARAHPPHLRCIAPTAPAGRYLNELPAVGGAFGLQWTLNWLYGRSLRQEQGNLAGVDWETVFSHRPLLTMDSVLTGRPIRLFREFLNHPTRDAYWQRILFTPADFAGITIPTLTTTGWFDGDQPGALFYWRGIQAHNPRPDQHFLIAGPWNHSQTFSGGALREAGFEFTADSRIDNKAIHRTFFDWCLKGTAPAPDWPRARTYVMGANRWQTFGAYPPVEARERSLYLRSGGRANTVEGDGVLSWDRPADERPDRFRYDPRNPVRLDFRDTLLLRTGDHRPGQYRHDVLVYSSEVLTERVAIAGTVAVELFAASDGRDTDFVVKLLDVQPDGRALKLGVNPVAIIRARYRNGLDREVLLIPNQVERYRIEISDLAHAFEPGHRIRLEVTSSAAPFFNPNQNTGNPIATDTVWRVAEQTIYHDRRRLSRIIFPVIELGAP